MPDMIEDSEYEEFMRERPYYASRWPMSPQNAKEKVNSIITNLIYMTQTLRLQSDRSMTPNEKRSIRHNLEDIHHRLVQHVLLGVVRFYFGLETAVHTLETLNELLDELYIVLENISNGQNLAALVDRIKRQTNQLVSDPNWSSRMDMRRRR